MGGSQSPAPIAIPSVSTLRDESSWNPLASQFTLPGAWLIRAGELTDPIESDEELDRLGQTRNNGIRRERDWLDEDLADEIWSEIGAQLVQGFAAPWN